MQGFNMGRYVPPDLEGTTTGNALNKKHPLGSRASKLASHGILTVRFEMPFAVWCSTCPKPTIIGQGVRFNAEKKRIGYYHSSPVFSFRIKHTACGGEIEIRTDPQNTRYVVVSGAKVRDTAAAEDRDESLIKTGTAGFVIPTPEERADLRESAFGKLEKTIADREKLEDARQRIGELQDSVDRHWDDPYAQNQRLRKAFRVERHKREHEAARTEDLRERMSLGVDLHLLPGTEEDARRAALVDFGRRIEISENKDKDGNEGGAGLDKALAKPLFEVLEDKSAIRSPSRSSQDHPSCSKKKPLLKSEIAAAKVRNSLISELAGNTRAAKDPFLDFDFRSSKEKTATPAGSLGGLLGIKKKRTAAVAGLEEASLPSPKPPPPRESKESGTHSRASNSPLPSPALSGNPDGETKRADDGPPLPSGDGAAISSLVSYGSDSE
ncbi:CWC16 protein [Naviculisporaceae sp. PSN 640]